MDTKNVSSSGVLSAGRVVSKRGLIRMLTSIPSAAAAWTIFNGVGGARSAQGQTLLDVNQVRRAPAPPSQTTFNVVCPQTTAADPTVYTLPAQLATPPSTLAVYRNGLRQAPSQDYTVSGTALTIPAGQASDLILVDY